MAAFHIDPDISSARTLDKAFYTYPEYFEQSKKSIFQDSWQFIGNASSFTETNRCSPLLLLPDFIDEPLVVTSSANGLKCLSNVCTHRGNMLVRERCDTASIRCSYHGRMFRLDGQFVSMPEFREVKNFPSATDDLPAFPLGAIGDLLFTTMGNQFFDQVFAPMLERISFLPLQDFVFREEHTQVFEVDAHWALYCENYLEGFHIPFVHAALNAVIDYGNYTTELLNNVILQVGIGKAAEGCFELPVNSVDYGRKIAAYYFFVFPNMMFNFYPWGLSLNIVEPVSLRKTRVRFLTYVWKPGLYNTGAGAGLHEVEMEDEDVVRSVQQGIQSNAYRFGRYSVTREQGIHNFHRLVAEAMK